MEGMRLYTAHMLHYGCLPTIAARRWYSDYHQVWGHGGCFIEIYDLHWIWLRKKAHVVPIESSSPAS